MNPEPAHEMAIVSQVLRPLTVLIVDDSAMMRAMIKRVTALCDVPIGKVLEAANGAEAIKILEAQEVDALFTDINMPVMTGTELLRAIAGNERWRDLVRVIISTDGSEARRIEVKDLDVRLYVEKPFRPEVMRDVLYNVSATHTDVC
ncbi:MAG: response regulator [Acidobacteria bacterium]|nr:response regulator [Acidobacteriota bacterium]